MRAQCYRNENYKKEREISLFFLNVLLFCCLSLKAANGPRFFCLLLYGREKYGHPISGAVVRFAHPERHHRCCRAELFVIQPGLRTKNGRTYIHDKSRCCRWSRVVVNIVRTLYTVPGDDTSQLARRARISSKRGGRRLLSTV